MPVQYINCGLHSLGQGFEDVRLNSRMIALIASRHGTLGIFF
jgi:hypothetical protein